MRRASRALAALCLLTTVGGAQAGERYYLLVFGAQRTPTEPGYTHSWATFARAPGCVPADGPPDSFTLSWMPRTLVVRPCAVLPEEGVNLDIEATFRWVEGNRMRVSLWGPYRIKRELYCLAREQCRLLNSGRVRYKAVDVGYPSPRVSNCIHGIIHAVQNDLPRVWVYIPGWGETASYHVARRLEPWIIDPCRRHEWVVTALGLDGHPMIRRELVNPRTGGVWGLLREAAGRGESLGRGAIPPRAVSDER